MLICSKLFVIFKFRSPSEGIFHKVVGDDKWGENVTKVDVSVIIPTYNYGEFIQDAIDSVLNQTYGNFEILIIDDGSTDNTKEIIGKYDDGRIRYFYKENEGPSAARNYGIKESKGDYICFLDADDIFHPEKLSIQINQFNNNPEKNIGLIYSDYICIDKYKRNIKYFKAKRFASQEQVINYLKKYNFINTSTVMIKREILDKVGYFDEGIRYLEDLDLWLRIGRLYNFSYVNKPLVKTRSHNKSLRNNIKKIEKIKSYSKILEKH